MLKRLHTATTLYIALHLQEPHVRNTAIQIVVKERLRQREFYIFRQCCQECSVSIEHTGMIAGLPSFSCLPTQSMNAGISARAVESIAILEGSLISVMSPVIDLTNISMIRSSAYVGLNIRENVAQHRQADTRNNCSDPIYIVFQLPPFRVPAKVCWPLCIRWTVDSLWQSPECYRTNSCVKYS